VTKPLTLWRVWAFLIVAALLVASCGGSDNTTVDTTAPTPAAAVRQSNDVVAVDATPVNAAPTPTPVNAAPTPTPTSSATASRDDASVTGTRVSVGATSIVVPAGWVPVADRSELDALLSSGQLSAQPTLSDPDTIAQWQTMIAQDAVGLAVDPQSGSSASLIITPSAGLPSPVDDPQAWIATTSELMTGAVPGLSYEATPSQSGALAGVRSVMSVANLDTPQRIEQFTTLVDRQLVTVTVTTQPGSDASPADQILGSLQT